MAKWCAGCGEKLYGKGPFCPDCFTVASRALRNGLLCLVCGKVMKHSVQVGTHFTDRRHWQAMVHALATGRKD